MDHTDEGRQKQTIKIFVNSVLVYDNKVVITFNYFGDDRTITFHKIDAGLQHGVRLPCALCHQKGRHLLLQMPSFLGPTSVGHPTLWYQKYVDQSEFTLRNSRSARIRGAKISPALRVAGQTKGLLLHLCDFCGLD